MSQPKESTSSAVGGLAKADPVKMGVRRVIAGDTMMVDELMAEQDSETVVETPLEAGCK